MAGTAIVRRDTRLLLFQALGHTQFEGLFFDQFKKSGAGMAYEFAKKYYTVTSEPYLITASHCVLGLCNLGLALESKNQLHRAIMLVQQKSLVQLFQLGWEKLSRLARMKSIFEESFQFALNEEETELAEAFSAEPDKNWIGLDQYHSKFSEYRDKLHEHKLKHYMTETYVEQEIDYRHNYSEDEVKNSLFFSLLISDRMHAPLKMQDFDEIWKQPEILKTLRQKLTAFALTLQPKLQNLFLDDVEYFFGSAYLENLILYAKTGRIAQAKELIFEKFYIRNSINEFSKERYNVAKAKLAMDYTNLNDLQMALSILRNNSDISDKMALIDLALKKISSLSADSIDYIMDEDETLWQSKIRWHLVNNEVFQLLINDKSSHSKCVQILADILTNLNPKVIPKLQLVPTQMLYGLCRESKANRDFLFKHITREPELYNSSEARLDPNIVFIPVKYWPELWRTISLESADMLFKELMDFYRELKFSPEQKNAMLLERVRVICLYYRRDQKAKKKDYPVCEAPYFNEDLKKAVAKALQKKQFESFSRKLADSL